MGVLASFELLDVPVNQCMKQIRADARRGALQNGISEVAMAHALVLIGRFAWLASRENGHSRALALTEKAVATVGEQMRGYVQLWGASSEFAATIRENDAMTSRFFDLVNDPADFQHVSWILIDLLCPRISAGGGKE